MLHSYPDFPDYPGYYGGENDNRPRKSKQQHHRSLAKKILLITLILLLVSAVLVYVEGSQYVGAYYEAAQDCLFSNQCVSAILSLGFVL